MIQPLQLRIIGSGVKSSDRSFVFLIQMLNFGHWLRNSNGLR